VEIAIDTGWTRRGGATYSDFRRFASAFDEPSRRLRFFSVAPASSKSSSEKSPSESDILGVEVEERGNKGLGELCALPRDDFLSETAGPRT